MFGRRRGPVPVALPLYANLSVECHQGERHRATVIGAS